MTHDAPSRLSMLRQASLDTLDGLSPAQQRAQSHAELSPLLWHVGHVFFVENYWLAERVFDDRRVTDAWRALYFPEACAKTERAIRLPDAARLRVWANEVSAVNDRYWEAARDTEHALLADGYLAAFIRSHYAQHLETMRLARAQLALSERVETPAAVEPVAPAAPMRLIPAGCTPIGTDTVEAYDNERPGFNAYIEAFEIAQRCVTNAEWLGFIEAGGYQREALWDHDGWAWRCREAIEHPQHWRPLDKGWAIPADHGPDVAANPVHGIGWYEARAFAAYAGLRLPDELEWEAACRQDALPDRGAVWEWCDNAFYPYEGFAPFPYDGYSLPWFDDAHFVARGASRHTEIEIRRPSFRNFYPPTHRHVFAGLRLAR